MSIQHRSRRWRLPRFFPAGSGGACHAPMREILQDLPRKRPRSSQKGPLCTYIFPLQLSLISASICLCPLLMNHARIGYTCRQIAEYTETIAEMTEEYLPKWDKVAGISPAFNFILPLVNALAKSTRPPLPDSDAGLLRRPLHAIGMRCGLPSCGNQTKVCS